MPGLQKVGLRVQPEIDHHGNIGRKCGSEKVRWVFVGLVGKGKRIRTVPIPPFVKVAIDAWTAADGLSEGPLFGARAAGNIRKRLRTH
jgi:hypothetical protein